MLIEVALAAALFHQDTGACAVGQGYWSDFAECVEVTGPRLSFGEVSIGDFTLQPDPEDEYGNVGFNLSPAPTEGYYQYGVIPGCLRDGVVTQAGPGGMGYQPLGSHSETPGYKAIRNSDPGYTVRFESDPCISPGERVVVAIGGYSETEPVDPDAVGWTGDRTVTFPSGKQLRFTIMYNASTNTVRIESQALGDTPPWDASSYPGYYSSWSMWAGTSAGANAIIQCGETALWASTSVSFNAPDMAGWSPDGKAYARAVSPGVACAPGEDIRVLLREFGSGSVNEGIWLSTATADAAAFVGQAMIVKGLDLGSLVYQPFAPEFDWMPGQCSDMECVTSYCSSYSGVDIIGWLGCFFSVDISPIDWYQALWENIKHGSFWVAVQYTFDMLLSYPRALVVLNGDCGMLFDLNDGPLAGLSGDTCDWPYQGEVRAIGAAFVYILGATTLLRLLTRLMIDGHPGYFGFYTWPGEEQGKLW